MAIPSHPTLSCLHVPQICNVCHDARPEQRRLVDPNDRTPDSDDEEGEGDEVNQQPQKGTGKQKSPGVASVTEEDVLTSIKEQEESCVIC